jgi:acyl-coenzyme A thioesterase PaaI-like protein
VRCEAKVVHVGRSTGIAEARMTDGAGKLLGIGTTACAIFRA